MTPDADLHQLIGQLKADMDSSRNQRKELFDLVRYIGTSVTELQKDMKHHMEKEDNLLLEHGLLDRRVGALENLKSKIIGYGIGLSMVGGTISERISRLIG